MGLEADAASIIYYIFTIDIVFLHATMESDTKKRRTLGWTQWGDLEADLKADQNAKSPRSLGPKSAFEWISLEPTPYKGSDQPMDQSAFGFSLDPPMDQHLCSPPVFVPTPDLS